MRGDFMKKKIPSVVIIVVCISLFFSIVTPASWKDYDSIEKLQEACAKNIDMLETPDSTAFSQIGYWGDEEILGVTFRKKGNTYYYVDVPVDVWISFATADSLGTFFNEEIKGNYKYTKVAKSDAEPATMKGSDQDRKDESVTHDYVANKNTKKFHYSDCPSVDQMKSSNRVYYYDTTRDELIADGYKPCGNCNP